MDLNENIRHMEERDIQWQLPHRSGVRENKTGASSPTKIQTFSRCTNSILSELSDYVLGMQRPSGKKDCPISVAWSAHMVKAKTLTEPFLFALEMMKATCTEAVWSATALTI
jgi:hypothetical protein